MNSPTKPDARSPKPRLWRFAGVAIIVGLFVALLSDNGVGLPLFDGQDRTLPIVDGSPGRTLPVHTLVAISTPSYQQLRVYNGVVQARRTSELSFARPAKLERVLVQEGQEVQLGDAVAEQNTSQLKLQQSKLEDARISADRELSRLIADSRLRSMEAIRIEVRDLKQELSQLRQEITGTSAPADGTAPPQNGRTSAEVRLDAAQQRLAILDATSGDPKVTAQRAVVADLNRQLAEVEQALQDSTLRAPFDGVIARRYVSEGVTVSPQVPIVRIVELGALQASIGIPADQANDLRVGQTHLIRIAGAEPKDTREIEAKVYAKLPELDRTSRTRTVIFSFDDMAVRRSNVTRLLPGEVVTVELPRQVKSDGFWLPITSLVRAVRGLWSVYVVQHSGEDRVVVRHDVELIHVEGEIARVRGTLNEGDLVIADGTHRVVPGQQVEPVSLGTTLELVTPPDGPSDGAGTRQADGARGREADGGRAEREEVEYSP